MYRPDDTHRLEIKRVCVDEQWAEKNREKKQLKEKMTFFRQFQRFGLFIRLLAPPSSVMSERINN